MVLMGLGAQAQAQVQAHAQADLAGAGVIMLARGPGLSRVRAGVRVNGE